MRRFFKNRIVVVLLSLTLVLIILGAILNSTGTPFAENAFGVIVTPIQHLFSGTKNGIQSFFAKFGDVEELTEENEALRAEVSSLKSELRELESAAEENKQLRKMLSLKESSAELELEAASVIAADPTNWYSTFTIDKGTKDGVELNQAVITSDKYLVGRVCDVGSTWARVITLTDPEHSAGCMISRSRDLGVVECDSELSTLGRCRVSYLTQDADVIVGDYVETSGIGGVYPEGLQIGRVVEIHEDTPTMSQYAIVEISADINHLTQVFVVKNDSDGTSD